VTGAKKKKCWKPCPFCGSMRITVWETPNIWTLECDKCHASGPEAKDEESALSAWNKR